MVFCYQFVVPDRLFIEFGRRLPMEQALIVDCSFPGVCSMQLEKPCGDAVAWNLVNGVVYVKAKRWRGIGAQQG